MLKKREEELRAKKNVEQDSAFARLVNQGKAEKKQLEKASVARSAIAHLLEKESKEKLEEGHLEKAAAAEEQAHGEKAESQNRARLSLRGVEQKLKEAYQSDSERAAEGKLADDGAAALVAEGKDADRSASSSAAQSRKSDAKATDKLLEEKREGADKAASTRGGARFEKGDLESDADRGGTSQNQGGDKKESGAPPSFRFNPALMAPVPVAQAKENRGSERLRAIANEIAQKIVERVRVGTNAAGKAEFQIDLRSNVLKGLSIKVSGGNGKISAVFSGSDREVLKLLREQSEQLKSALSGRGLTLEELRIEEHH